MAIMRGMAKMNIATMFSKQGFIILPIMEAITPTEINTIGPHLRKANIIS